MEIIKLNKKDYSLLEILDKNSRSQLKEISNHLGISKQACNKKILKLDKKIILKHIPIIDYFKLGYNNIHIYFKLRGVSQENYINNIKDLKKIKSIVWLSEFFGEFDVGISIFYCSIKELGETLKNIYRLFGKQIIKEEKYFIKKQLIPNFCHLGGYKRNTICLELPEKILNISEFDKKIISFIRNNARFNYFNISNTLKKKSETIKNHIQNLENKKIIRGYKILIDYNELGYIWSLCHLEISKGENINNLLKKLNSEKRITFISITIENKIIVDFISKDYSEIKSFLENLKWHNKEIIDYNILNINKIHKIKES